MFRRAGRDAGHRCGVCRRFDGAAQAIERDLPALAALSSGHGASRTGDGVCRHHDRLVNALSVCPAFQPAGP